MGAGRDRAAVRSAHSVGDPDPLNNHASAESTLHVQTHVFLTIPPCRLVDTREPTRGGPNPLGPGPRSFSIRGPCAGLFYASALAVNVTVTEPTADGHLKIHASGSPEPDTSHLNYRAGQTRSNNGIVSVGNLETFTVDIGQATGSVHVIIDEFGYFR